MTDLRDRMRIYDQAPAPDYWNEVELRASSRSVGTAAPARSARPLLLLAAAAMLLALAVGGAALALSRLVDPPPDSSVTHLAYGLDGDIYLADVDGTNPVRIADGVPSADATECGSSFYGFGPMWSPDGRYLAYRSDHWGALDGPECAGTVYLSDADGQPVASFPGTGWLLSWSPDANRIATWVDLWETIGVYGIDGVRQALLTVPPGCARGGDFDPMWSPDGQSIWVAGCHLPIDGSTPTPVPEGDPRSNQTAAYSPDGTRVAYLKDAPQATSNTSETAPSFVVAQADGSQDRVLISEGVAWGYEVSLVWSPTGDRIAFHGGPSEALAEEILVVDVASGSVTSLASARAGELIYVLAFSRDGDRILFARRDATNYDEASLWSVNADGSNPRLLVTGTGWGDWQQASTPDSR
jgi:Tol biopolymer transport system component